MRYSSTGQLLTELRLTNLLEPLLITCYGGATMKKIEGGEWASRWAVYAGAD